MLRQTLAAIVDPRDEVAFREYRDSQPIRCPADSGRTAIGKAVKLIEESAGAGVAAGSARLTCVNTNPSARVTLRAGAAIRSRARRHTIGDLE
jgi:hypothetical protein